MKIVIGEGSCGLAAGAGKVHAKLDELFAASNPTNAVVTITSCIGMCFVEPIVDVYEDNGALHRLVRVKVEDAADAAIMFKNGCLYNLYACNIYGADSPINIELIGEKGRLGLKQDMGYYELDGTYAEIRNTYETTNVGPDYWGSSHHLQIRDFYRSVREDLPVVIDGLEGRKTLEMVKGIYLSSARRERIILPFEDVIYSDLNQPSK